MARGKNISDADMRRLREEILGESGRTMSDADREAVRRALDESGRTISDADRARLLESYINRNDGGIAKKTRVF
jgi:hypothetical protein